MAASIALLGSFSAANCLGHTTLLCRSLCASVWSYRIARSVASMEPRDIYRFLHYYRTCCSMTGPACRPSIVVSVWPSGGAIRRARFPESRPAPSSPSAFQRTTPPGRYRPLWEILKVSDGKATHHFYQKGTFGLNGEVSFTRKGR